MPLPSPSRAAGVVTVLALFTAGCDLGGIGDLEDDLEVILNVPGLASTVAVQIVDAATDLPVDAQATVTITGPDAASVIDPIFFEPVGITTTGSGTMVLGIRDGVVPSADDPLVFALNVQAPGFLETSTPVVVTGLGLSEAQVAMVRPTAPPHGVAAVSRSAGEADADGTIGSDVTVETPPEGETGGQAVVQVAAGTRLTTAEGAPLQGPLTAEVTYFNNHSPSSLAAFPGGLDEVRVEGDAEPSAFVTAGFVAVDLRDGAGREAHELSDAAQVALSIPEGSIDPETGQPIRAGDPVPLWSLDPSTGVWRAEGTVVAESPASPDLAGPLAAFRGSANLVARFETTHFSYFNLDFKRNRCRVGHTFAWQPFPQQNVSLEVNLPGYWSVLWVSADHPERYDPVTLRNAPRYRADTRWRVRDRRTGQLLTEGTVASLCDPGTTTIRAPEPDPAPNLVNLELTLEIVCTSGGRNTVVRGNYPFYWRPAESGRWQSTSLRDGQVSIRRLSFGSRYELGMTVHKSGGWTMERRSFTLTDDPEPSDLGPGLEFVSGGRDGDRLTLSYRTTDVSVLCNRI